MATFWDYFSVLAPSVGLALIFWLVMRSVFRVDTGEREAKAVLEEREAREWANERASRQPGQQPGQQVPGDRAEERTAEGGERPAGEQE